ncbi:MAG TPA: hypothetical protein VM166_07595 [Gemmatimonadaceae bacterium]|nr:hypothetical protein [Gemmatimonadaceae bacterium]
MISSTIGRANAFFLAMVGFVLLFASDDVLPRVIPTFPPGAAWFGQLLAAALLALAVLNWFNRSTLQGGIYGRPIVSANATFYFVSALALLKVVSRNNASMSLWVVFVPFALFAAVYVWLMFRGPFERDIAAERNK